MADNKGAFAVILPAAGHSTRFGDPKQKKIFADLNGRAVWLHAVSPFLLREDVAQIILAIAEEDRELFERRYQANIAVLNLTVIEGGAERYETVARGLEAIDSACEFVAVHDAARPCVDPALIERLFQSARQHGAAVPGWPVADTLKRVDDDSRIVETVARDQLFTVQTPQVFRRDLLERAYANLSQVPGATDCARLVEAIGHPVQIVEGSPFNLKITTTEDLRLAQAILQSIPEAPRDRPAHPFAEEQGFSEKDQRRTLEDLF